MKNWRRNYEVSQILSSFSVSVIGGRSRGFVGCLQFFCSLRNHNIAYNESHSSNNCPNKNGITS
jgi:hypothetical protein